tara:strand:- start:165 stop:341 length:177 start_codon:yes stop_codon:yes gene_type:complete
MKTTKKVRVSSEDKNVVVQLFNEYFQERINEEKREKQTLLDKFNIHLKGKDIVLDNSK